MITRTLRENEEKIAKLSVVGHGIRVLGQWTLDSSVVQHVRIIITRTNMGKLFITRATIKLFPG
jgi:hypothetical protein